jgi:hypothetical protein
MVLNSAFKASAALDRVRQSLKIVANWRRHLEKEAFKATFFNAQKK